MTVESLLQASAEARVFLAQCKENLPDYFLYPEEDFEEIEEVSLGTIGTDLQGEKVTLEKLEKIVERVNEGPFWTTLYHNPTIHPIGRILVARLFKLPEGIVFVAGLIGKYDRAKLPRLSDQLNPSSVPNLDLFTGSEGQRAYLSFNPFEIPVPLIKELIEGAPDLVDSRVLEERRKTAHSALKLLRLVIPAGLVFGALKKVGEKVTELATESLFNWVKETVTKAVGTWSRENNRTTLLSLETEIEGCVVEYVTSLKDAVARVAAVSSVYTAFAESISIVQQLITYEPTRLVLEYDEQSKRWIPLYLVTRRGVFTDRPYLEVIRARGLSLASRMVELPAPSDRGESMG